MPVRPRTRFEKVRAWLRPPRRLRLLRPGGLLIGGIFGLGLATLNTGNNLLYLLLGALLGFIALSGLLSEQALRGVALQRRVPRAVTAGEPVTMRYRLRNTKRQLPSYAVTVRERTGESTFVLMLPPRGEVHVHTRITFARRGVYRLGDIALSTTFPFGLFRKERDVAADDVVVVRPAVTRAVRPLQPGGRIGRRTAVAAAPAAGIERGEFRGLRTYRPGDEPRDVHWPSFARTGEPIVREHDREVGRSYLLHLDTAVPAGTAAEVAVEITAALAAAAAARGDRFGLTAGRAHVTPGTGPAQLDRVLDALARVAFPEPSPHVATADECVWIGTTPPQAAYADVFIAGIDG